MTQAAEIKPASRRKSPAARIAAINPLETYRSEQMENKQVAENRRSELLAEIGSLEKDLLTYDRVIAGCVAALRETETNEPTS